MNRANDSQIRQSVMAMNPTNESAIGMIEAASFVVCLDEASPTTPEERIKQLILGDGLNRWYDKLVQIVVCSNAETGFVTDHSKLDGSTMYTLHSSIKKAIREGPPAAQVFKTPEITLEECIFSTSLELDNHICRIREEQSRRVSDIDYSKLVYPRYGAKYFRDRKISPNSGYEIIVQLATRLFFGYNQAAWQAVNMSHFHKGRVDIFQSFTPAMEAFCIEATKDTISVENCRELFLKAARDHNRGILRVANGEGYDRTLTAMEQLGLEQGYKKDEMPSFYSDDAWVKTRPQFLLTGGADDIHSEAAFILRNKTALWVLYHISDHAYVVYL